MSEEKSATANGLCFHSDSMEYRDATFYRRTGKWLLDFTLASLLLVALLPFFLLIAAAIALTSRGRVILVQPRIGQDGHRFGFLKFRTMTTGQRASEVDQRAAELALTGILLKPENDPRVTLVGRFLRRHSLDELPQLINIIKGEMSLVGPRPLLPFMVEPHPQENRLRTSVLPGLTGYWQIYARSESNSLPQMIEHDMKYIESISLWTDLRVLAATLPRIVTGDGAK